MDYWDYLGWSDRFARAEFSRRQRAYRQSGGLPTVYTPGMLLDGREWRGWLQHSTPPLSDDRRVGRLHMELEPGGSTRLTFQPKQLRHGLEARLVVLGFGIASPIGGGENAGKILTEDFVVLGLSHGKLFEGESLQWRLPWPELRDARTDRLAVAAWVSTPGDPSPIQAVGGRLP